MLPSFFKSKASAYTPATGLVGVTRAQFMTTFRTRPMYRTYVSAVGATLAGVAFDNMFDEALRSIDPVSGVWKYGAAYPPSGRQALQFVDQQSLATFFDALELLVDFDIKKIANRQTYIAGLKAQALAGTLSAQLALATEPEISYYTPAPARASAPGAPPVPPRPVDWEKAKDWLAWGVAGSTAAFTTTYGRLRRTDQRFPLGRNDQILRGAWKVLVPNAPAYRGWNNVASQQKYPSSIGGAKVLDDLLLEASGMAMPAAGDNRWYDLALYLYGSIMTAQPFTDGNKRACRLAYVLMLTSGGVAFKAPNAALGARLADMM